LKTLCYTNRLVMLAELNVIVELAGVFAGDHRMIYKSCNDVKPIPSNRDPVLP
jgi:hypothetical protein